MNNQRRSAFTLIEVIAAATLIGVGVLALVGVAVFGVNRSIQAQATSTAMPTAVSVAYDPAPLLPTTLQSSWNNPAGSTTAAGSRFTSGWMNGYWVERTETTASQDILGQRTPNSAQSPFTITPGRACTSLVVVNVFSGNGFGRTQMATFTTRILRQDGM
jgi:type II secretory pathway pseudopilin PulG